MIDFLNKFPIDGDAPELRPDDADADESVHLWLARFGGVTFGDGLYRGLTTAGVAAARRMTAVGFPTFWANALPFASDWRGNVFAVAPSPSSPSDSRIVLFELGDGEAYEIPCTLRTFHRVELVEHPEECLGLTLYSAWRKSHSRPGLDQCAGWTIPMFLGGDRRLDNLRLTDQEVYWHLTAQMIQKTRDLAPGSSVRFVGKRPDDLGPRGPRGVD